MKRSGLIILLVAGLTVGIFSCGGGGSGNSDSGEVPGAPSSLDATLLPDNRINLFWIDNSDIEDGFLIERSTDGTSFLEIADIATDSSGFTNTGLTVNTTYWYRVAAHNASGVSAYSNTAAATTRLPGPGDIVINEILQNPSAVSDGLGEWFELYNASGTDIDINGWTMADNDFDSHVIANGGPLVIQYNGYLVLGINADPGTNGGAPVDYSYGGVWFLSNLADEIVLQDSALQEIDRVEYDGGPTFPDPNGAAMALRDPFSDNNLGSNWGTATTAWPGGSGDLGTPGVANDI